MLKSKNYTAITTRIFIVLPFFVYYDVSFSAPPLFLVYLVLVVALLMIECAIEILTLLFSSTLSYVRLKIGARPIIILIAFLFTNLALFRIFAYLALFRIFTYLALFGIFAYLALFGIFLTFRWMLWWKLRQTVYFCWLTRMRFLILFVKVERFLSLRTRGRRFIL